VRLPRPGLQVERWSPDARRRAGSPERPRPAVPSTLWRRWPTSLDVEGPPHLPRYLRGPRALRPSLVYQLDPQPCGSRGTRISSASRTSGRCSWSPAPYRSDAGPQPPRRAPLPPLRTCGAAGAGGLPRRLVSSCPICLWPKLRRDYFHPPGTSPPDPFNGREGARQCTRSLGHTFSSMIFWMRTGSPSTGVAETRDWRPAYAYHRGPAPHASC